MRSKKIILDTNLWISFLITRKLDFIDALIEKKKIKLIFSDELIEEFLIVAKRPKFEKYFSDSDIKELLLLFKDYGKLIKVKSSVNDCRDIKDNFLLNLAIDGKVDFLVTGDKDLLILEKIKKTKILSMPDFMTKIS
jgi:uncharacterized protein